MRLRPFLVTALVAAVVAAGAVAADGQLAGSVGPGYTIRLLGPDGFPVQHLDAGTYAFVVDDRSEEHNFHLTGPGVDETTTTVEGIGRTTFTVTLRDGNYTFMCDPHSNVMSGTFSVGAGSPPPPPPVPPAAKATKLTGVVGPGATISLRNAAGVRVRTFTRGTFVISIRDLSKRHNFHLSGAGVNRRTGLAQTGTVTWKLTMKPGKLLYVSDASPLKLRGAAVVR